jgi:hypothetical protein
MSRNARPHLRKQRERRCAVCGRVVETYLSKDRGLVLRYHKPVPYTEPNQDQVWCEGSGTQKFTAVTYPV